LLGAANLGDLGQHFPDTSAEYKDIDSKILLKRTVELIREQGYFISNIDSTVCLQQPKIKSFIPQMQEILARTMEIPCEDISIKATTTEKLGYVGREEGIAAYAVVLITK
jgi:2-C-methyl-D-erythritol 2,4-cyclodiphosphate synthase